MLRGGNRTICMIWHMLKGLDLNSLYTDPAGHLIMAVVGSIADYVYDMYDVWYLYYL